VKKDLPKYKARGITLLIEVMRSFFHIMGITMVVGGGVEPDLCVIKYGWGINLRQILWYT